MRTLDQIMPDMDFDLVFFMATLMLLVMGTVMIFSSSYFISKEVYDDSFAMIGKHLFHLGAGVAVMGYLVRTDYRKFNTRFFVLAALVAGIIACILCFVPGIGITGGHARRWIRVPFLTVQASEIMKISLIFYLAYSLCKKTRKIQNYRYGVLPVLTIVGISALLILVEPDFGTAATIGIWSFFILFIAGMRIRHLVLTLLAILPAGIIMMILEPYRRARLLAFINPWEDMHGIGYQSVQSMVALASGGIFGSGLGEGTQKLFFLPAPHTDFIFSVLGEELGFLGILFIVALFGFWIWRGYTIAMATNDDFGFLLVVSAVSLIGLQAVVNMGVAMSVFPTTGISLPFFSYGGSSLVTAMAASGIVLSVSRRARL
ncbi:MAG: putative lipid II flippase FtsW [Deltaproteobacteria bacterium]|nr:putative lipid II flippase FtsW [Deltaproteobacteria bacterium]MDX9762254.1 putative lipid II flippase FtsW [Desulfomonilia bacterium]HPW69710.1 putative lipid II flippase FtsW [Deltaproteobacteria bacterium]